MDLRKTTQHSLHAALLATCLLFADEAKAVQTESTVHEGFTAFDKGSFVNVGITHDGKIFPSQELSEFASLPTAIAWNALLDHEGNLIVSTGNNGAVYRVNSEGESTQIFLPPESLSRAIAIDKDGYLYVGTSPKGRVYRLRDDGTHEVFFSPEDLYIWDMMVGEDEHLYVATGGKGKVYRIPLTYRLGEEVQTLFEASETHVNKIAFTPDQTALIIGCGTGGNLYQVELDGSYRALFHTGAEEIKTILPQEDGSVYFSTFSSASSGLSQSPRSGGGSGSGADDDDLNPYLMQVFAAPAAEGNGLFRLDPSGHVQAIWHLPPNRIFSVYQQPNGRWLIGSGTNGRVFRSEGLNEWSNILTVPTGGEVTHILSNQDASETFVISSNPARVYRLGSGAAESAIYTSDVIDTGKMVQWGSIRHLSVKGTFLNGIVVETRSGNVEDPNRSWSAWEALRDQKVQSPGARFLQYRIRFDEESHGIQRMQVFYQEHNLHPTISQIRIIPGAFLLFATPQQQPNVNFAKVFSNSSALPSIRRVPQLLREKEEGAITAVWMPGDPNRDRLLFDLKISRVGDPDWLKIASDLENPIFAMDIRGLDEGFYQVKVIADDRLDNTPDQALRFAKISDPFLVDFTSPKVEILNAEQVRDNYRIELDVEDKFGVIERAYAMLDGGPMQKVMPVDGMFDSTRESFVLSYDNLSPGAYSVVFQAYDENGNVGIATHRFQID